MENTGISSLLIILTLAASFGIIGGRSLEAVIKALAAQAVLLTLFTLSKGWTTGIQELYFSALLSFVFKVVIFPYILFRVSKRLDVIPGTKSYVSMKMSFVLCAALVILSYTVTGKLLSTSGSVDHALPAGVAMMLIGLFIMMTRKRAITQVVGLLVIENGVFLAAVGATVGMPPVIELGILLDALAGVLIMGILTFRIHRAFATINTENLKKLRG